MKSSSDRNGAFAVAVVGLLVALAGVGPQAGRAHAQGAPSAEAQSNEPRPPEPEPGPSSALGPMLQAGLVLRELSLLAVVSADLRGDHSAVPGATIATRGLGDIDFAGLSIRHRDYLMIGYASGGVEGEMSIDSAIGTHIMLGPEHGPVLRVGLHARLFGNDVLYDSLLEFPQGQIGYQWLQGPLQLEAAGRAGLVLVGRLFLDSVRQKPSLEPELGGYATLRWKSLRAELDASWVRSDGSFSNVQRLESRLCFSLTSFSACLFATKYYAQTDERGGRSASWLHAGLSLSLLRSIVR